MLFMYHNTATIIIPIYLFKSQNCSELKYIVAQITGVLRDLSTEKKTIVRRD